MTDLNMLMLTGGRERTERQLKGMLNDAGFNLTNIEPVESMTCLVEAVLNSEVMRSTMLIAEEIVVTSAAPEAVWSIWRDVAHWKTWDPDVAWSRLDGTFELGTSGELKPTKGPKSKFKITQLVENRVFVDEAKLPFARLTFYHELTVVDGKTNICHRVEVTGLMARFFAAVIGGGIRDGLPTAVRNLARQAEAREAGRRVSA